MDNYNKRLKLSAGAGGAGVVSFSRLGKPDGGSGGQGGSIHFVVDAGVADLAKYKHMSQYRAGAGSSGGKNNRNGKSGADLSLSIPVNTSVYSVSGEERSFVGNSLSSEKLLVAQGGQGGRGNRGFVSSTNRSPMLAEAGEAGETVTVELDTRLLSDICLVGYANSGKSELVAALCGVNEFGGGTEAAYTLSLRTLKTPIRNYIFLEIPESGLFEGARDILLKHVSGTKLVVLVLSEQDREAVAAELRAKIAAFDSSLLNSVKCVSVVVNASAALTTTGDYCVNLNEPSSVDQLRSDLIQLAQQAERPASTPQSEGLPVIDLVGAKGKLPTVELAADGKFHILHQRAVQLANGSDLDNLRTLVQYRDRLDKFGLIAEMEKLGLDTDSVICVGGWEFEWG